MLHHFRKATDTLRELICYYVALVGVGALLFSVVESVPFGTALYWAGITVTTIGYGDVTPHSDMGRILSVVLANLAVFGLAPLIIARILSTIMDNPDQFSHTEQEELKKQLDRIEAILSTQTSVSNISTPDKNISYADCTIVGEVRGVILGNDNLLEFSSEFGDVYTVDIDLDANDPNQLISFIGHKARITFGYRAPQRPVLVNIVPIDDGV